jgi:nucleoside 2-deoxyribosyltransferase
MTDMNKVRVYLAGPFFNDAQVSLIKDVETALTAAGIPHFSPRKMDLNGKPTTTTPTKETAGAIFRKDYEEICRSTHVLAVIDWAMNPGYSLRVCKDTEWGQVDGAVLRETLTDHLALPDSGTVWEMGCAYALRVPVYLYTVNPAAKMNLMLSQSAKGVIYGPEKLRSFLNEGMCEESLEEWKGAHR